jgi:hypothetical protein
MRLPECPNGSSPKWRQQQRLIDWSRTPGCPTRHYRQPGSQPFSELPERVLRAIRSVERLDPTVPKGVDVNGAKFRHVADGRALRRQGVLRSRRRSRNDTAQTLGTLTDRRGELEDMLMSRLVPQIAFLPAAFSLKTAYRVDNCSYNQALANRHSLLTVRGEMPRTCAVSSTVRPEKYRSSTMRA